MHVAPRTFSFTNANQQIQQSKQKVQLELLKTLTMYAGFHALINCCYYRRCNAQQCKVHIAYRHRYTDIDVCRTPFCLLHFTLYCIAVAESAHILNQTNSPYICAQARELAWLNFLPIGHQSEKQRRSSEFNFNSITFPFTFN